MIYRVTATLLLANEGAARGPYNHLDGVFPQALLIHPNQPDAEYSEITLEKCYHDENPSKPCEVISHKSNEPGPP